LQIGTYPDGRPLNYDQQTGQFDIGGSVMPPDRVRLLSDAKKVSWTSEEIREWFEANFRAVPAVPPLPSASTFVAPAPAVYYPPPPRATAEMTPAPPVAPDAEVASMRKCARCDSVYDAMYDGCPVCARGALDGTALDQPTAPVVYCPPPPPSSVLRPQDYGAYAHVIAPLAYIGLWIVGFALTATGTGVLVNLCLVVSVALSWFWAYADMARISEYQVSIAGESPVLRSRTSYVIGLVALWIVVFPYYLYERHKWLTMTPNEIRRASAV